MKTTDYSITTPLFLFKYTECDVIKVKDLFGKITHLHNEILERKSCLQIQVEGNAA